MTTAHARLTAAGSALTLTATALAAGPLLAYDGFDSGPRSELTGSTGGEGWTSAWQDSGSSIPTSVGGPDSGLTFPDLAAAPGSARTAGGWLPDMTDYVRTYPAVGGDVMYVSCLIRPEPEESNWYILRFGTYPRQVDLGVPIGYYQYGLMLGDGLIVSSPVPTTIGVTHLLVLEIAHDTGAGHTTYSLYVDPAPGAGRPLYPDASFTRAGIMPFGTSTELRGEGGFSLDELRIGTTWESVTPASGATCRADCNRDGRLNINDFICFQNEWQRRTTYGDYNADGKWNINDFVAFQSDFTRGCP